MSGARRATTARGHGVTTWWRRRHPHERRSLLGGVGVGLVGGLVLGLSGGGGTTAAATPPASSRPMVTTQRAVLDTLPGRATGCVAVGSARDVRSGGLAAGPFDTVRSAWSPKADVVRLYLVPNHAADAAKSGTAEVRGTSADGRTFTARTAVVSEADEYRYFDLALRIPAAGTWTLRATAGPDSGCWTVRLG